MGGIGRLLASLGFGVLAAAAVAGTDATLRMMFESDAGPGLAVAAGFAGVTAVVGVVSMLLAGWHLGRLVAITVAVAAIGSMVFPWLARMAPFAIIGWAWAAVVFEPLSGEDTMGRRIKAVLPALAALAIAYAAALFGVAQLATINLSTALVGLIVMSVAVRGGARGWGRQERARLRGNGPPRANG